MKKIKKKVGIIEERVTSLERFVIEQRDENKRRLDEEGKMKEQIESLGERGIEADSVSSISRVGSRSSVRTVSSWDRESKSLSKREIGKVRKWVLEKKEKKERII